ncbi:hypothetical protein K503DRAFT_566155 [Rhizopogon vinicolor AM-OR11-026]|uniref:Uncharacterized protein n=1 Tax=Rhizopogon vinicolor AM-OR11-026 TaxID=1314800 RepID=A0A1B7MK21_9AGAM|nr:hypothetical protein K503DRAFT_566155 [Rhizopogon vinicolor AM-OR11-026]
MNVTIDSCTIFNAIFTAFVMPGRSRRARRLTRAENLIREFIKFKEKRTLRRKRLRDNLRDERARIQQGIRKPCHRHDTFTVPLFNTILSELSSSSSSEDDIFSALNIFASLVLKHAYNSL